MTHGCVPRRTLRRGFFFQSAIPFFSVSILTLILLLSSTLTHAATTLGVEEQRLRQQRDERSRQERIEAPDVQFDLDQPEAVPQKLPVESPCFAIDELQLVIPEAIGRHHPQLQNLLRPGGQLRFLQRHLDTYRGACIGTGGINQLIRQLTALLLERGYTTTRLGVPAQDLSGGVLQLTLIPGIIRSIRTKEAGRPFSGNALPCRAGQLLNIRDLEQGLEQMLLLPSQDVAFDLVPGEQPGESDIIVRIVQRRPVRGQLSLDDSGSDDTGRWRAGATLWIDGPLGLHDQLEVGYQDNADRHSSEKQSEELRIRYAVPFGWWRAELAASRYEYRQRVEGRNQSFMSRGETERIGGTLTATLLRSQQQKLDLQFALRHRESSSFIDDTEISIQRRDLTEAEAALVQRFNLGRSRLDLKLAHHWGTPWFGSQDDFADRLPGDPSFFYKLQTLDLTLAAPFSVGPVHFRQRITFHGQYADEQLFASEQLAIGSRYTVRGFDGERMLSAERGFYLRSDLDFPLAQTGQTLFIGLDYGQVSGPSARYLPGKELAGGTVGLRGGWKGLGYEAFASWPLKRPSGFETDEPAVGVSLSLTF